MFSIKFWIKVPSSASGRGDGKGWNSQDVLRGVVRGKVSGKELSQLRTDVHRRSGYWWPHPSSARPGGQPRTGHRKVRHPSELGGWSRGRWSKQQENRWASSSEAESQEWGEPARKRNKEVISGEVSWKVGIRGWRGLHPGCRSQAWMWVFIPHCIKRQVSTSPVSCSFGCSLCSPACGVMLPRVYGYEEKQQQKLARGLFKVSPDVSPCWAPAHSSPSGTSRVRGKEEAVKQLGGQISGFRTKTSLWFSVSASEVNTVSCGKAALTSRLSIPRQSWEGAMKLLEESVCCFSVLKRVLTGGGGGTWN